MASNTTADITTAPLWGVQVHVERALNGTSETGDINVASVVIGVICVISIFVLVPMFWWKCIYNRGGLFYGAYYDRQEQTRREREMHNQVQACNYKASRDNKINHCLVIEHIVKLSNHSSIGSILGTRANSVMSNSKESRVNVSDDTAYSISSEDEETGNASNCQLTETATDQESKQTVDESDTGHAEMMEKEKQQTDMYATKKESSPCRICLEPFEKGDDVAHSNVSGCQHAFHRECIVEWLQQHDECPCCRAKFVTVDAAKEKHIP